MFVLIIVSYIFGNTIDMHCGGVDLMFPHHENEEAQSCAHHGTSQWVNYWIHIGINIFQFTTLQLFIKVP